MAITINQGDYVYFQDTSTGSPDAWSWIFAAGTPNTSTSQNPIVRYLSPTGSGNSVGVQLTASKDPIYSTSTQLGIIEVLAENIAVTLTPDPSVATMDQYVSYSAYNASPASVDYYTWYPLGGTFAYGVTGTGESIDYLVSNWYTLTGSELGATYSSYAGNAQVFLTSLLGNVSSDSALVTYSKNGPNYSINFTDWNSYEPMTVYYTTAGAGVTTIGIGMGTSNGYVLNITCPGGEMNNPYFRAQGEAIRYYSDCMDLGTTVYPTSGIINGQVVASAYAFGVIGVTPTGWESLPRYVDGNYMLSGDVSDYFSGDQYFADVTSSLTLLENYPRYWSYAQIIDLGFNQNSIASQTSKSLEIGALAAYGFLQPIAQILGQDGNSGSSGANGGCCMPTLAFTGDRVELYFTFNYSTDGSYVGIDSFLSETITVIVSDLTINGGNGNSPDGRLVFAEDTAFGPGLATLIQVGFDDYFISKGTTNDGYVVADASPDYAYQYTLGAYDVGLFNGLRIRINKAADLFSPPYNNLYSITISDNLSSLPPPFDQTIAAGRPRPTDLPGNWLCFLFTDIENPAQSNNANLAIANRGWYWGV